MRSPTRRSITLAATAVGLVLVLAAACGEPDVEERFVVPDGAGLNAIADTLASHRIIKWPKLFRLYVRMKGADGEIKAGTYELRRSAGWSEVLNALVAGNVATVAVTIPEGWTITQIAERVAPLVEVPAESVAARLLDPALSDSLGAPGPNLEGYLYPETYRFAQGISVETVAAELTARYRAVWTAERRAALDSLGWSETELLTLASIIQAEARWEDEMPLISAVFHNRLRRRMRLQADPTVQYALETRQSRLLFTHIDSVADNPYNTYTHSGLPPGPIGSPGSPAIDAALHPADVPYLYFVARDDGRHEFSQTLRQHNRSIEEIRRQRRQEAR